MLIVCPSCASEYTIDPAKLGPQGRTVRCAICRDTWLAAPEGVEPPAPAATPVGATLLEAPKRPPARRGRPRLLVAAACMVLLAVAAWQVPRPWLEIGRAAATQLVRPERPDLSFRSVASAIEGPVADRVLKVTGEIVNRGSRPADLPPLEFLVQGGDEHVLATWTSAPPRPRLGPAETARFEARLVGPPAGAREVRVQFTKASGVTVASRAPF
jgi:predicted Zn finger-like uncharacterized protein